MPILKRTFFALITSLPLVIVITFVPYPKSWEEATTWQILSIFLALLIAATFLLNIFLNNLPKSFIGGLGVLMGALLQSLGFLNYLTAFLLIIIVILVIKFFPKIKVHESNDIPKLKKLSKQKKR